MEGHCTEGARTAGGVGALSLVRIRPDTVILLVGIDIGAGVSKIMIPSNQSTVYPQISTNEIAPLLLEVLIVVLTMSEEATQARLKERHQDSQREVSWLQVEKYFPFLFLKYSQSIGRVCGRVEEGEERVLELEVEAERTREEILQTVMDRIQLYTFK